MGQGRCYLHGGLTPIKHGRYSSIRRPRIRELIEEHERDPDPLNVHPELAALRALFQDFIERYDDFTEALLAWHASFQLTRTPLPEPLVMAFERIVTEWEIAQAEERVDEDGKTAEDVTQAKKFLAILRNGTVEAKPRTVLDISDAYRILGEIGRMVERVEKIRSANAISRPDLNRIMQEMWRTVDTFVGAEDVKAKIRENWLTIAL